MILYPFQPGIPYGYSITGFDEANRTPGAELYLLAPGAQPPAQLAGGYVFCPEPGCADARLLQPVQTAAADAPAVWCDTQISGGNLEAYLRTLLGTWGARLWVWLRPMRLRFGVPCPSGAGEPLSEAQAAALRAAHPSHFSPDFLCRYSFYLDEDGKAQVFLFDTQQTCREKLACLRALGVRQVFGPLPPQAAGL